MKLRPLRLMQAAAWSGVTLSVFIGAPQPLAAKGHALTLTCAGKAHQMDGQGPFQPRETFALSISGRKAPRVSIGPIGSRKSAKARILDDNPIQLKFATSKFTGEYFHFTGDLVLIDRRGQLSELRCKPAHAG